MEKPTDEAVREIKYGRLIPGAAVGIITEADNYGIREEEILAAIKLVIREMVKSRIKRKIQEAAR